MIPRPRDPSVNRKVQPQSQHASEHIRMVCVLIFSPNGACISGLSFRCLRQGCDRFLQLAPSLARFSPPPENEKVASAEEWGVFGNIWPKENLSEKLYRYYIRALFAGHDPARGSGLEVFTTFDGSVQEVCATYHGSVLEVCPISHVSGWVGSGDAFSKSHASDREIGLGDPTRHTGFDPTRESSGEK